ncbi:MAG TPA: hypothetical protein DCX22_03240 [Dehalococcoidia bacterium]|nr:hypothetical protein [Dehalococcoidia bacterium]
MTTKEKGRVYQNTAVRRAQIADAAGRLIVRYGSEHITVRRIANEIGITEGAIYRHFKSKRDILLMMADMAEDNLLSDIVDIDLAKASAIETLHRTLNKVISQIANRKGFYFQVIAEIISFGDKKLNNKTTDLINKYIERIKDIIATGIKAGEIRQNLDTDTAATMFFSMIQGLVNIWTLSNYEFKLEEKAESLWQLYQKSIVN